MIYYFTSTGNCEYVARRIAEATGDTISSVRGVTEITVAEGESLGFVFPTYFWALPQLVEDTMCRVHITYAGSAPYTYFVATYGTTPGAIGQVMKTHMKKLGLPLTALYGVKMPDDWSPWFDLTDAEAVAAICAEAEPLIDAIIAGVKSRTAGDMMTGCKPRWMTFFSLKMYESYRKTKKFTLEDTCIGCGKCAAECPEHAIEMQDGKPVWAKKKCTLCLHCLHSCPTFSIQYGKKTKLHGQYSHKTYEK